MSCNPNGFLSYNTADLVPHGFIFPRLSREFEPNAIPQERLDNPPPGTTFEVLASGNIVETRKQLPASGVSIEVFFRKLLKSTADVLGATQLGEGVENILGFLGAGAGATLGAAILNTTILGGLTAGVNQFSFHILDAETKVNLPRVLTTEEIGTGIIKLDGYPLSVFAVTSKPVPFTDDQLARLGAPTELSGINGTTSDLGQFRFDLAETQLPEDITNIFFGIVFDERRLRFRADNDQATSSVHTPFSSSTFDDVTSDLIAINTSGLTVGDTIYITANIASNRKVRHLVSHDGRVAQGSSRTGVAGSDTFGVTFRVNAWNFKLRKWLVPVDFNREKVPVDVFLPDPPNVKTEEIEGWRLSETISTRINAMWSADSTGIVFLDFDTLTSTILVRRQDIFDQDWYNKFLSENNLDEVAIKPSSVSDAEKSGALYDINDKTNALLFDREKIPYDRRFALALQNVSKYDTDVSGTGVGSLILDLFYQGVVADTFENLKVFDLSFSDFEITPMSSILPSAYGGEPCTFDGSDFINTTLRERDETNGAYFNPRDPENRFAVFIATLRGELEADWLLETPIFLESLNTKSRIYVEHFGADFFDFFVIRQNIIYANTFFRPLSTISAETNHAKDTSYIVFKDNDVSESISYHTFKDYITEDFTERLEVDPTGVHAQPDFDHEQSKLIGSNRLLGDFPSYQRGRIISHELNDICVGNVIESDIFLEVTLASSLSISDTPHEIAFDSTFALKEIVIEFSFFKNAVKDLSPEDALASIFLNGSDSSVDNINIPVQLPVDDVGGAVAIRRLVIDMRYYKGDSISLFGDIWKKITIKTITATVIRLEDLSSFVVDAEQMSVAFDYYNKLCIFYADQESNNISVLYSIDDGQIWFRHKDIIRLTQGESATQPYALSNNKGTDIRLFYVLNNEFLMFRDVDLDLFDCNDLNINYVPPESFDISSVDDIGLEEFTNSGKAIRKTESFFVCGDKDSLFFNTENAISQFRKSANRSFGLNRSFRFVAESDVSLDTSFADAQYAIFIDKSSVPRIFIVKDGMLSIKVGSSLKEWRYLIKDIFFHKNFIDDEEIEIQNIQVIHNNITDELYVLYFHNKMLFTRKLQGDLLELSDEEGNQAAAEDNLRKYLDINIDSASKPVFLVGNLNDTIKTAIETNRPDLLIEFCYPPNFVNLFNENLAVDDSVQPDGYFTTSLPRVFYQSDIGLLHGLTIRLDLPNEADERDIEERKTCSENPKLDVQMKLKP